MLGVVDIFAQISQRDGLVVAAAMPAHRPRIESRYGNRTDAVVERASYNADLLQKQARWEFARSTGMFALIEQDPASEVEIRRQTAKQYRDFFDTYFGAKNAAKREAFSSSLRNNLSALIRGVSEDNRKAGARPHEAVGKKPKRQTFADQQLASRDRMIAIHEDPRAGFLPFGNGEKNTVMAFLDYLDNPKYPLGVSNQLLEVFNHQSRLYPRDPEIGGDRALQSIVYVLGDYLGNALRQLGILRDLEVKIADSVNPNVTLVEEFGANEVAYGALARFADVSRFVKDGVVKPGLGDVLKTSEHRWTHRGPGRHKITHDQYTHDTIDPAFADRIAEFAATTTIREARGLVYAAVANEQPRAVFHRANLTNIATVELTGINANLQAIETARQELDRLDAKIAA